MKKTFLFCAMLLLVSYSKADQLAYLTLDQAIEATEFLQEQSEVIIYCACCDGDAKKIVKVTKVYYEYTGFEDYYEIKLEGEDSYGNVIEEEVDLAYLHFKLASKAYCVGSTLAYDCDPCTEPFSWSE